MSSRKKLTYTTQHKKSVSPFKSASVKRNRSISKQRKQLSPHSPQPQATTIRSKSRQQLSQSLNTYTLLIRTSNPIRCLVHNSNVSMYCQTEQKLLCANCIFGRTQHKFHRVTPIDRSIDKIEKDVETMNRLIDRELDKIGIVNSRLRQNLMQEEKDTHQGLSSLISLYEQCHKLLEQNFMKSKERIVEVLEKTRIKYEHLILQLSRLNSDYSVSGIMKSLESNYFKKEQFLLYEHAICSAISKQKRFEEKDWIHQRKQVQTATNEEKRKISSILQMLIQLRNKNQ